MNVSQEPQETIKDLEGGVVNHGLGSGISGVKSDLFKADMCDAAVWACSLLSVEKFLTASMSSL